MEWLGRKGEGGGGGRKARLVGSEVMGAQDGPYGIYKVGMNEMGTSGGVGTGSDMLIDLL